MESVIREWRHGQLTRSLVLPELMQPRAWPSRLLERPSRRRPGLKNAPKFMAILVIVHVLAFFLLLYAARLLKKLADMIPGVSEKQNVVEIASEIEQTAAHYFSSATLINACVGVSVWMLVGLLGLPHPLLWGVAAFLLHYIPFVGATGGIVAMTLVSLIHFDSVWYALLPQRRGEYEGVHRPAWQAARGHDARARRRSG
jgi:hypothetical protein